MACVDGKLVEENRDVLRNMSGESNPRYVPHSLNREAI
jgi:hypothetical protein